MQAPALSAHRHLGRSAWPATGETLPGDSTLRFWHCQSALHDRLELFIHLPCIALTVVRPGKSARGEDIRTPTGKAA